MKTAFAAVLTCALAACSQAPSGGSGPDAAAGSTAGVAATPRPAGTATTTAEAATTLTQYHWQLEQAVDASGQRIGALFARAGKPLQLDFDNKGVSISNACNRMHGSYSVAAGKLTIGNLASTLMACNDPALTALDTAVGRDLPGTFSLAVNVHGKQPRLTLSGDGGNTLTFTGLPTDATRYGGEGETVFLEVAPQTRPCPAGAAAETQCLYVRTLHYGADGVRNGEPGDWHVLAQDIEGYTHQPGARSVLRVKRYRIGDAPAGAASSALVLDMVVESELLPH